MGKLRLVILIILLIIAGGAVLVLVHRKQKIQYSTETEKMQKQDNTSGQNGMIRIGIRNETDGAHSADIWILQDNRENRRTSSWGTASAGKLDVGNNTDISVTESPDGRYLIRIIDVAGLYYEANDILLKNGETVVIKDGNEEMSAIVEVLDKEGKLVGSYDMFVASL